MHASPTGRPWEVISADFMGPFPRSRQGKTILLVLNDKFTKWSEIIPLHAATTPAAINALRTHIFGRYGWPSMMIIDNDKQFVSHKFKEFLHKALIKHRCNAPYARLTPPNESTGSSIQRSHNIWTTIVPERFRTDVRAEHSTTHVDCVFTSVPQLLTGTKTPHQFHNHLIDTNPSTRHTRMGQGAGQTEGHAGLRAT